MHSSHTKPPALLDQPLEIDPADWNRKDAYYLLTGLVIPRPVGWISTISADGVDNVAPYSYFNAMGADPLLVGFSSSGAKDTYTNAASTREFVWNIVSMDIVEQMNFTATDFPPQDSEFEWSGLTAAPSQTVKPRRVAQAKAHFECEVAEIVTIGNNHIVIGKVKHIHVDPSIWKDGRVDPRALDPACRLSGSWYGRLGETFRVARSTWKGQVEGTTGQQAMPRLDKSERS